MVLALDEGGVTAAVEVDDPREKNVAISFCKSAIRSLSDSGKKTGSTRIRSREDRFVGSRVRGSSKESSWESGSTSLAECSEMEATKNDPSDIRKIFKL